MCLAWKNKRTVEESPDEDERESIVLTWIDQVGHTARKVFRGSPAAVDGVNAKGSEEG